MAAIVATTVVAIAAAATSGLALCRHEVAVAIPMAMPMGSMPMAGDAVGLELCPVVIGLAVFALSLGIWAVAAFALEGHRRVARHRLIGMLAGLPVARTAAGLIAVSAVPVALVILVDDGAPSSLDTWLLLMALVAGGSIVVAVGAILGARVAMACGRRLVLRIVRRLRRRSVRPLRLRVRPRSGAARVFGDACLLAAGLGWRGPPQLAR